MKNHCSCESSGQGCDWTLRCISWTNSRAEESMKLIYATGVLLLVACTTSLGFDTGHHSDLTEAVLREKGFGEVSINVARLENWLIDYYSSSPTSPSDIKRECEKLHFDNLYSTKDVTWYWNRISHNAMSATKKSAQDNDPLRMLSIIGMSLHATQDFYSHSNWVETHPRPSPSTYNTCLLYTSPSPRDQRGSRMPSSA